jgi:C-terminal processing protease CtpA/Prc
MKRLALPLILVCLSGITSAQLLPDQKLVDFQNLAALYAKQYAPYAWKRDVLNYDMLKLAPWLDKVRATKDDLGFYEVGAAYVASLNDAHSEFFVDSDFQAYLGFDVDLYDGKALIDNIDPSIARTVTFQTGDELVSVDGKSVADWLVEIGKYSSYANARSTSRYNALLITDRVQSIYPRAVEIGDTATVVIRRKSSGNLQTYTMPWATTGTPFITNGPVPSPVVTSAPGVGVRSKRPVGVGTGPTPPRSKYLMTLRNNRLPAAKDLRGFDAVTPVFQPSFPSSFVRRLGRSTDFFYSGTFTASGKKIGYIRIPDFQDPQSGLEQFALSQFDSEMIFMKSNTDGLVVDVMRNPGGDGCYAEALLQDIIPFRFRGIGNQIRVTQDMLLGLSQEIDQADVFGFDQLTVDQLNFILSEMQAAYKQNRGLTDPLPQCGTYFERDPATDSKGNSIAYTKQILLLTDEFSTSAAELFSAKFQDSQRGPIFGWRTAGAGGSVGGAQLSGFYSESASTVTLSLLVRTQHVLTPDFPVTDYIENVGVRPDITLDYMTEDNLTNRGKAFVAGFTQAMLDLLQ